MIGIIAALVSASSATAKDTFSKKLSGLISPAASTLGSFIYALPFYALLLPLVATAADLEALWSWRGVSLVALRSLSDACAETFKMRAIAKTDVSVVGAMVALSPVFLLILGPLVLGDTATLPGAAGVLLIVSGSIAFVLLASRTSERTAHLSGIFYGIAAAFFFSLNTCFDKLAALSMGPITSGAAVTLGAAFVLARNTPRMLAEVRTAPASRRLLYGRGICETIFMSGKLLALQTLAAPYVVALQRSSVLLTVLAGGYFFAEERIVAKLLAATLVVAGVSLIVIESLP